MFQITSTTEATLAGVTPRVEKHGDEDVPAVSLQISVEAANTLLDSIDPAIRQALYMAVAGQDNLPGIDPATPVLRCNSFDQITLTQAYEGWKLEIDDSIDEDNPMTFGLCKVDKLRVDAKQGGSIVLKMRIGTSDVGDVAAQAPLTDEQIAAAACDAIATRLEHPTDLHATVRAIERAHGIGAAHGAGGA